MTTALQLPVHESTATTVGRNLRYKQVLPVASINYKGRKIDFSQAYLAGLVENFNAGAYGQVPFVLADADNTHTLDPERYRGEVRSLSLADDGLYALIDLTDDGARVVDANPRLGVSARIVEDLQRVDGKKFGPSLQHVLGTLDPRVVDMKPWQQADQVALSAGDTTEVVDLTAATYQEEHMPDTQVAPVSPALTDDEVARLRASLESPGGQVDEKLANLSDEDIERILGAADDDASEIAAATVRSAEAIELANANAVELAQVRRELDAANWRLMRETLGRAGVKPAILDIPGVAELAVGKSPAIELSNGTSTDVGEVVRKMLTECAGQVDLSNAVGSPLGTDADTARDDALLAAWSKHSGN